MITLNEVTSIRFSNMGLFTGDADWIHPKIATATYELIFVVKGEVFIQEADRQYALQEGDALCLQPNTLHQGFRKSDFCSFFWLHFYADGFDRIGLSRFRPSDFSSAVVFFKELNHLASLPGENDLIECKLLTFLLQQLSCRTVKSKLFNDVSEFIRIHGNTPLSVVTIAQKFHYNPDYLSKVFIKNCGLSLKKYLIRVRLDHICKLLLSTSLSVKEIAELCGFESDNALIKFFQYNKRQTPSDYRNGVSLSHLNNR